MIIGNVELKEVRIFSNGKADIIFEKLGGSDYYAETFKWRYDGNYISFSGNTNYQFRITGYLFLNSTCATLVANTRGPIVEPKTVLNRGGGGNIVRRRKL